MRLSSMLVVQAGSDNAALNSSVIVVTIEGASSIDEAIRAQGSCSGTTHLYVRRPTEQTTVKQGHSGCRKLQFYRLDCSVMRVHLGHVRSSIVRILEVLGTCGALAGPSVVSKTYSHAHFGMAPLFSIEDRRPCCRVNGDPLAMQINISWCKRGPPLLN